MRSVFVCVRGIGHRDYRGEWVSERLKKRIKEALTPIICSQSITPSEGNI